MQKRFLPLVFVLAGLMFWPLIAGAQTTSATQSAGTKKKNAAAAPANPQAGVQRPAGTNGPGDHVDGWGRPVPIPPLNWPKETLKSGPAPVHDISGTWEPARGWRDGVQAHGPDNYLIDGRRSQKVPLSPLGEEVWKTHKYMDGEGSSPYEEVNDPFKLCDPPGFPRVELEELRGTMIVQLPKKVLVTYQNDQIYRTIWTDGRAFPEPITEPRWFGYSTGKWVDDTTFVVETVGMDERTWVDNIGDPHTADLRVEEKFHRANHDILEITVTIIDPTLYTKPWNALDKYPMRLQSGSFDVHEMLCSESEAMEYEKHVGDETEVKH
jgi:hypothetical protein